MEETERCNTGMSSNSEDERTGRNAVNAVFLADKLCSNSQNGFYKLLAFFSLSSHTDSIVFQTKILTFLVTPFFFIDPLFRTPKLFGRAQIDKQFVDFIYDLFSFLRLCTFKS